jgi:hypothetical protein
VALIAADGGLLCALLQPDKNAGKVRAAVASRDAQRFANVTMIFFQCEVREFQYMH